MIKKIIVKNAVKEANFIRRSNRIPQKSKIVEKIINDVIKYGDSAILKYTKKYDKVKIDSIIVDKSELKKAYKEVTANQLNSLKKSKKLLEKNEKMLLKRLTGIISSGCSQCRGSARGAARSCAPLRTTSARTASSS